MRHASRLAGAGGAVGSPPSPVRLFLGIYPPIESARGWLALAREAAPEGARPTPAPDVHMTLHFLGERPADRVDAIADATRRVCAMARPFTLRIERLATMPARRPRLLATLTDSPVALLSLRAELAEALRDELPPGRDDRFTPHMTLGRFRPGNRARPLTLAIPRELIDIHTVRLMRSELGRAGATHEVCASLALSARHSSG